MGEPQLQVGPYTLLAPLGRGGWAEVFRARDAGGRLVALKRPLPGVPLDPGRAARFRREGEVVRALDVPGVVRLLDTGEHAGRPWLAYELVDGARTLDRAMAAASTGERVRLVRDAATALGAAHARGVVHRDVTPANVLVDAAGRVRIADFGLAAMVGLDPLTASGVVVGTPGFLAPELGLSGREATSSRCDVWSLGVLLFLALTGQHPFEGVSFYELVQRGGAGAPSPRSLRPTLCDELERACRAALSIDPDLRPRDGAALAAAVTPCLTRPCLDDGPDGAPRLRPLATSSSRSTADLRPSSRMAGPAAPTSSIGRYALLGELGRGGMGTVFRARDLTLGRDVALKLMDERRLTSDTHRARFDREAAAAAAIRHENLVAIHEAGVADGRPYLVMDLVDGESLEDRLARGPLPPREAARLVAPVARALAALHAARVVHRDVKPANILVDGAGTPRLTDFGLAKLLDERERLTRTNQVVGTAHFMAPEQCAGGGVDERADVYGLGATLYALLTGAPPQADADSLQALMARRLAGPPPAPSTLAPDVPRDLDRITLACLAVAPEDRFASAEVLAAALETFLSGGAVTTPRARRRALGRRATLVGLAAGGVLVALVASAVALPGPAATPTDARADGLADLVARGGALAALDLEALDALAEGTTGPAADEALALRGLAALARGDLEAAGAAMRTPPGAPGPLAVALRGALGARRADGDAAAAVADLTAAISAGLRHPELRGWRAQARARGELDARAAGEVLADLGAAERGGVAPDVDHEAARASALLALGRLDEARAALQRVGGAKPGLAVRVAALVARRELDAGDVVGALDALGAVALPPGSSEAVGLAARADDLARATLGRWSSLPPPDAEAEQGAAALRLAARLRPPSAPFSPELTLALRRELTRYDREVPGQLFLALVAIVPPDVTLLLPVVATAPGVRGEARAAFLPVFERLLALGVPPEQREVIVLLHAETLLEAGRAEEAVAACDRLSSEVGAADRGRVRFLRGRARQKLGQLAGALDDFEAPETRTAGVPELDARRAETLLALGRRDEALAIALAFIADVTAARGALSPPGIVEAVAVAWTCGHDVPAHADVLRAGIDALLVREPTWACWELRLALLQARAGEVEAAAARLDGLAASRLRRGDDLDVALRLRPEALARALRTSPDVGLEELTRVVVALDRLRGASARP